MISDKSATWEVYQVWSAINELFPIMAHYYMRGAWAAATGLERLWFMDFASTEERHTLREQGFNLFF